MKKISLIIILIFSIYSYAKADDFQVIKSAMSGPCEYVTEDGKNEKLGEYMYSNLCAEVYKTNIDDLDKAYTAYKKYLKDNQDFADNILKHLPDEAPKKRKDKNKIHLRFMYNDVDFNLLLLEKSDGIYVYDYTKMWYLRMIFGGGYQPRKINDKLSVIESGSKFVGKNLISKDSNLVIKNAYYFQDNVNYIKFIVNTNSMEEAYEIIREYALSNDPYLNDYAPEDLLATYPKTLDENTATKRISDDYVITELLLGVVDNSVLTFKKDGDVIYAEGEIAQP